MKKLILIKLGGSVITDKSKPFTANSASIKRFALELKKAKRGLGKDTHILLGHGQGSYAHIPASKYKTKLGLINKDSVKGFCETSYMAIEPNRILMKEFLKNGLPVATFSPLSFMYAKKNKMQKFIISHITKCFDMRIIPVIYGDVIMDEEQGFTIFSTEKSLTLLAGVLRKDYQIVKIIECGDTNGVYDEFGKTIPKITPKNFSLIKKAITGSKATDVTGGMIHKVEESLDLAKKTKIPTLLISGLVKGNLTKAILGEKVVGTEIC